MDPALDPAAAPSIHAIERLRAALDAGQEDAIRAAFLETERALERLLERGTGSPESRATIDAAIAARLVVPGAREGAERVLVEILVLGWSLRAGVSTGAAHHACFGTVPDVDRDLERLRNQVVESLVHDEERAATLRIFLLERAGRVENQFRVPAWEHESEEEVRAAAATECCRQFARRRAMFAAERLTRLPDTLEGRLHEARAFDALVSAHEDVPLLRIQLRQYGYLDRPPIVQRLRAGTVTLVRRVLRATAGERWAYEWTQGAGRFAAQWALMSFTAVVVVLGLVAVTQWHAARRAPLDRDLRTISEWIEAEHATLAREAAAARADLQSIEARP